VYGWVLKESLRLSSIARPRDSFAAFFVNAATAAPPAAAAPVSQPPDAPPELPPPVPTDSTSRASNGNSMTANVSDLWGLYWPLFLAMVLGMCAKVLVDLLDAW